MRTEAAKKKERSRRRNRSKSAIYESTPGFAISLQQTVADEMEEVQQ